MALTQAERGAENLLFNCARVQSGERVLIATESPDLGYFDDRVADCVIRTARRHGMDVETIDAGFNPHSPRITPEFMARTETADVVIFLARLGDQLRFSSMPANTRFAVCFAHREALLASAFATVAYRTLQAIKADVDSLMADAGAVRITCPAGTEVTGTPRIDRAVHGDTTVRRFPLSIFTPVPAGPFSGRVALRFLSGTGSRYYDDEFLEFDAPVHARLEEGRLAGFDGATRDVARAEAHYDRVSELFDLDRTFVHSWHAGLHPGCGFYWDIHDNPQRWGGSAFGNPRILHFHTCGAYAPGEISWNVFDPSIEVGGTLLWDRGVLRIDRLPNGPEILARDPEAAALFAAPDPEIGVALPWDADRAQMRASGG